MPVLSLACHLPHNTPNIPSLYNNEQTTKQTKAINNSYIYIYISCKCDTNRAGHFTLDAYASRPVAWPIFGPLVDKNTRKGELIELPASGTWGLSFIRIRFLPLKSFLDFFLNVVSYQLESWFIHWVGCTTYWVNVSLEWDPCDLHVLSLGTVN